MQARNLLIGQSFQISSCAQSIRNLVCLRHSPTSIYAVFEERKGINESWKRTYDYLSNSTEVQIDESKPLLEVSQNSRGELDIEGRFNHSEIEKSKNASLGGRGRKSKTIEFPKGKFTIPDLAKKLGVSTTHIYLKITAMVGEGEAKVVEEKRKAGQRGRATKYYQVKS